MSDELRLLKLCEDERGGVWWMLCTDRGYLEIHVTPSGLLRVGELNKGRWAMDKQEIEP